MTQATATAPSSVSLTRAAVTQWREQVMKQKASGALFAIALTLTLTGYFTGASWLFWLALPFTIIGAIVSQSAMLRAEAATAPSPAWFAWRDIRISPTELRLLAASLAYNALSLLFLGVFLGANVILLLKIGHAIGGEYGGDMAAIKHNGNVLTLINLTVIVLSAWLLVRLSLYQAATVSENRVRLFGAWRLTARKYWSLMGVIIVLKVLTLIGLLLMLGFISAVDGKAALTYQSAGPLAALIGAALFAGTIAYLIQPLWSGILIACLKRQA